MSLTVCSAVCLPAGVSDVADLYLSLTLASCTEACVLRYGHDKQVITRTSGLQLGIISHFLIDPRTAMVVYLSLRAKGLGGQDVGMVPLSALTQIGDVVLVHDESAVMDDVLRSRGLVRLIGHSVQSYDGTPLGKVRYH